MEAAKTPPSHWIVSVARAAHLEGADRLVITPDAPLAEAWTLVSQETGVLPGRLAELVGAHYRLPVADLSALSPHTAHLLPARVARRLHVVPSAYTDRSLAVATADPVSMEAELEMQSVAGRAIQLEVAAPGAIAAALRVAYPDDDDGPEGDDPAAPSKPKPHVLVVDDDGDTRLLLRGVLESRGFAVDEADDGPAALETLDRLGPFDLVTLDLTMWEMDGAEVLRRIRADVKTATLPVIVATGSDDPAVQLELFKAGADDFIVKPVDPPRFLLRVQAVLRRRASSRFAAGL